MSGSSSGSQPQQVVTQTQTKDPWSASQPFLQQNMSAAAGLYNAGAAGSYAPWTGPTLAPQSVDQITGQNYARNLAVGEPNGSANLASARDYIGGLLTNQGLTGNLQSLTTNLQGNQNPFLQSILDTSNQRIGDRINSAMSGRGRYGSGQHADVMARALAQTADPILYQDYSDRQKMLADIYNQGAQRAGMAAQLTPTLDAARYASSDVLNSIGQYETNRAQSELQGQINAYNALQAYPWENLQRYNAIIQGAGGLGGSTVTTGAAPQQPSTMSRLLGGSLAGAGLGSAIFPGVGTGVGAAAGGLLGLLG